MSLQPITLEIIAILGGAKILGDKARERGRQPLRYQVMFVLLCIVGQLGGGFAAWIIGANTVSQIYLGALFGAAWGAAIALKIVLMLPDIGRPTENHSHVPNYAPNLPPSDEPADSDNPYSSPLHDASLGGAKMSKGNDGIAEMYDSDSHGNSP
jgi:hypothetical protein